MYKIYYYYYFIAKKPSSEESFLAELHIGLEGSVKPSGLTLDM
jgi:hypothetical protein